MRRSAMVLVLLLGACAPAMQAGPSPCTDPVYQGLRAQPVDQLSEREYERLREMERNCTAWTLATEMDRDRQQRMGALGYILGALGVLLAIGLAGS
jgi:hypothetical protein